MPAPRVTCIICKHPDKLTIEDAIYDGMAVRNIAVKFGVNYQNVQYHKGNHMAADMLQAYKIQRRLTEVMDVPDKMYHEWELLETLLDHTLSPFTRIKDPMMALLAVDRAFLIQLLRQRHRYFVTMLQVLGEMPEQTVVNVMMGTQWRAVLQKLDDQLGDNEEVRTLLAGLLVPDPINARDGDYHVIEPDPPHTNGHKPYSPPHYEHDDEEDELG
jgi:hypothetical protein